MKNKFIIIGLLVIVILTLSGCNSNEQIIKKTESQVSDFSFSADKKIALSSELSKETVELEESSPKETKESEIITRTVVATISQSCFNPKTNQNSEFKSQKSEQKETPNQESTQPKRDETTSPLEEEQSIEYEFEIDTNTETVIEFEPKSGEEIFDISQILDYAQSYAQNIGLSLDSSATECWDNPITANSKQNSIIVDIQSRLNRYKNIEGFSSVWIWTEKISDEEYEIYIGYC